MDIAKMEITELKIIPYKDKKLYGIAYCIAVFNESLRISGIRIMEGKKGVYIRFPKDLSFIGKEARRQVSNRILATYVVNHCMDDYQG